MVQLYCHFMETRRKAPCGQAASVGVPVGCVRIAKAALRYCTCVVLLSENVRKYIYMMKKISRRSFLQVCGITAATAALRPKQLKKTLLTKPSPLWHLIRR